MAIKQDEQRLSILDLSPELRNEIYFYALLANQCNDSFAIFRRPCRYGAYLPPPEHDHVNNNMLLSCKTVHQEATPLLYGTFTFRILEPADFAFLRQIGTSIRFLRSIKFHGTDSQDVLIRSFRMLKGAKQIQFLGLHVTRTKNFTKPETLAKASGSLIRNMHWSRQGSYEGRKALDVLEFVSHGESGAA